MAKEPESRYSAFSPARIWAIATNTLLELTRLKVFYFLIIFAVLIIGSSFFLLRFTFQEELQILKDVGLGSMSIFTAILAIAATALLLPKDIEDRTLFTVLAKPVPRYEYLIGKLLGVLMLLGISIAVMGICSALVVFFREQMLVVEATRGLEEFPEQMEEAARMIREAGLNFDFFVAAVIIFFKSSLLAAMTLLLSTFATTNIFTIIVAVVVYFIGHFQATARDYFLAGVDVSIFTRGFLALVSLIFPDLQLFNVADELTVGTGIPLGLFLQTAALGALYICVYTALACLVFSNKEL